MERQKRSWLFGLFAPRNFISAATLTLCALAGAVGMILELEKGFGGLVHISPEPMRSAVKALEAESTDVPGADQNGSDKLSSSGP